MVELTSTSASNGTRNWYLYWHRCISSVDVFISSDSGSAPEDDELRFARPQGSDSGSAPEDDELRLARPQGSYSTLA
jgi:hypothetical protein